ncbi:MAG TPA: hypothetical protein VJR92_02350 [Gemmatimonadaceae bacterium]|nr:hypothetical protein [Gemmatimonadaceae bacterium]
MDFEPKPISRAGVPAALEKAERYRLLNEPVEAESICLDVLAVEPENQDALVTLILAITDDLETTLSAGVARARDVLPRLRDEYKRVYYGGIICERHGMAILANGAPRAGENAYQWIRDAMAFYERAERVRPAGEDESILRWNTCARLLARVPHLSPVLREEQEPALE